MTPHSRSRERRNVADQRVIAVQSSDRVGHGDGDLPHVRLDISGGVDNVADLDGPSHAGQRSDHVVGGTENSVRTGTGNNYVGMGAVVAGRADESIVQAGCVQGPRTVEKDATLGDVLNLGPRG